MNTFQSRNKRCCKIYFLLVPPPPPFPPLVLLTYLAPIFQLLCLSFGELCGSHCKHQPTKIVFFPATRHICSEETVWKLEHEASIFPSSFTLHARYSVINPEWKVTCQMRVCFSRELIASRVSMQLARFHECDDFFSWIKKGLKINGFLPTTVAWHQLSGQAGKGWRGARRKVFSRDHRYMHFFHSFGNFLGREIRKVSLDPN